MLRNEDIEHKLEVVDDKINAICDVICEFNITLESEINVLLNELKDIRKEVIDERNKLQH